MADGFTCGSSGGILGVFVSGIGLGRFVLVWMGLRWFGSYFSS